MPRQRGNIYLAAVTRVSASVYDQDQSRGKIAAEVWVGSYVVAVAMVVEVVVLGAYHHLLVRYAVVYGPQMVR